MNKFDKLYNLILESIITLNKESRKTMIDKSNKILESLKLNILMYLNSIAIASSVKIADFLCKFFASGLIKDIDDKRIQQVIDILLKKDSFDIQTKISLEDFLKQNEKYTNRAQASDPKYLDSIPEFSSKKLYDNGVVIYQVDDTEEGMNAVRKIVDLQWGEGSNPWCLIARKNRKMELAWKMWRRYKNYPKHIAFQNGQLLAFCADDHGNCTWWDRNDKPSKKLKLLDGSLMTTPKFLWSEEYKAKKFLLKHKDKLEYNKETGLYDVNGDITILNEDLVKGHYPIKFGIVTGTFNSTNCTSLTSLKNAPKKVGINFDISNCSKLKSLVDGPEYIGDNYICSECSKLTNLIGCPKKINGSFIANICKKLVSLYGGPELVGLNFSCYACHSLKSLLFAPKKVGRDFSCRKCESLKSLIGAPKKVNGEFDCWSCENLTNLIGAPEYVGGEFDCGFCDSLTSLEGSPRIIKGKLNLYYCWNLTSLLGGPDEVNLIYSSECPKLKITEQDKRKYKIIK